MLFRKLYRSVTSVLLAPRYSLPNWQIAPLYFSIVANPRSIRLLLDSCVFPPEEVAGLTAQLNKYGRKLLHMSALNQSHHEHKQATFYGMILQKLSMRSLFSRGQVPCQKPIKSERFGMLTAAEAAEIVINEPGQFEILQKELRKSGFITNAGVKQFLLTSLLQERIAGIDAAYWKSGTPEDIHELKGHTQQKNTNNARERQSRVCPQSTQGPRLAAARSA